MKITLKQDETAFRITLVIDALDPLVLTRYEAKQLADTILGYLQ